MTTFAKASLLAFPTEVLQLILEQLSPSDLSALSATCTGLCNRCRIDSLWTQHIHQHTPGSAFRTYLINRAWTLARAIYSFHPFPNITPSLIALTSKSFLVSSDTRSFEKKSPLITYSRSFGTPLNTVLSRQPGSEVIHVLYLYLQYAVIKTITGETPSQRQVCCSFGRHPHMLVTCAAYDHVTETVALGTRTGRMFQLPARGVLQFQGIPADLSHYSVTSIHSFHPHFAVGTSHGEVIVVNSKFSIQRKHYIGPCSCPISSIHLTETHVIAGFSHISSGNGHNSRAVVWERSTGERIGVVGGSGTRSSSVFPVTPVTMIRADGHKLALWGERGVSVFDMHSWKCVVQVEGGIGDMYEGRLAIWKNSGLSILDFGRAISKWPADLHSFKPVTGV